MADNRSIHINLDVTVPVGMDVQVKETGARRETEPFRALEISHPPSEGSPTFVKPFGGGYVMCARGFGATNIRHLFAKVFSANPGNLSEPADDCPVTVWTRPQNTGTWQFNAIPVADLAADKYLLVWAENPAGGYFPPETRRFQPVLSSYTYCDPHVLAAEPAKKPAARDWSHLPECWQFHLSGVTNASCPNCTNLNGDWLLKREHKDLLWTRVVPKSFADINKAAWWRLSFNHKDGFWYLECVGDLKQPVGTSITYRRHESVFDPCGANAMALLTCQGYCHVPDFITISPA